MRPEIGFKGCTDEWEQRKYADVIELLSGQDFNPEEYNEDGIGIPYLTGASCIENGYTTAVRWTEKPKCIAEKGDTVLVCKGSGYGNIASVNQEKAHIARQFMALKVKEHILDNRFNYFLLNSVVENIKTDARGLIAGIARDAVLKQEIVVPCLNEQGKIGEYFSHLDHLITLHQRKYERLVSVKKSMLFKMFPQNGSRVPEIRFKGFTDEWEQRKLGAVAEYRNGKAHENEIDDDGEYIVVNSKFVSTNGEIRKFSSVQNEPLYENEIAFVLSDVPNGRAIAKTFLIDKSGKYTLNQRIAGITPHEDTDSYYLYIKMNRNIYFLKFDDGNKQTNLSIKDVLNYEDMYPSYIEQQKIGTYFRNLDYLITLQQRKIKKLQDAKKAFLAKMFA